MPFTEEEKMRWHREKAERESGYGLRTSSAPFTCIHCQRPFGYADGTVTEDVEICDVCNGD